MTLVGLDDRRDRLRFRVVAGPTIHTLQRQRILNDLEAVAATRTILDAIHASTRLVTATDALARTAGSGSRGLETIVGALLERIADPADRVTAIAAVHALARVPGPTADDALAAILAGPTEDLVPHASEATAGRSISPVLLDPLVELVAHGGLAGMHAQATLAGWSRTDPWLVAAGVRGGIERTASATGRHHLVETLGLIHDGDVLADLARLATDPGEGIAARIAAIAAFGDRAWEPMARSVSALSAGSGPVADAALLARRDRVTQRRDARGRGRRRDRQARDQRGVRIAQLHLGAELDPGLRRSGVGSTGGIATLLVGLDRALDHDPGIERVVTIGRGRTADLLRPDPGDTAVDRFVPVPLGPHEGAAFTDEWPALVAAERGIRRIVGGAGRPDLVHLRMADVGSLGGSRVAAAEGIRTVFSLAPDPHALIAAREASGSLDRARFGAEDARSHLWFRTRLVERLARRADRVVLFPREHLAEQLRDLVGIDIEREPHRFMVIPEGIDIERIEAADAFGAKRSERARRRPAPSVTPPARAARTAPDDVSGTVVADLAARIAALPADRQGLPIVLSVGRLHEVKGMARLASAFAADRALRSRANLVIVGGDLATPSVDERAELDRIDAAMAAEPATRDAVILLGHRPNAEIGHLLAAARRGAGTQVAPSGAYVCASAKEEFGLAIVEALAAGLPVVAPKAGGPATYVEDGRTGRLVDTVDIGQLTRGIHDALDLALVPHRAERAMATIRAKYDIRVMARMLTKVYARAADTPGELKVS